jgi:hypothetical protein
MCLAEAAAGCRFSATGRAWRGRPAGSVKLVPDIWFDLLRPGRRGRTEWTTASCPVPSAGRGGGRDRRQALQSLYRQARRRRYRAVHPCPRLTAASRAGSGHRGAAAPGSGSAAFRPVRGGRGLGLGVNERDGPDDVRFHLALGPGLVALSQRCDDLFVVVMTSRHR